MKDLVASLAFASDSGLYIKGITQDPTTGAVEAHTSTFATDVKDTIGNGFASSVANGITVSVVTTSGSVTSVSVAADNLDVTSITAGTGTFTNLTVGGSSIGQWIAASTTSTVTSTGTSLPTESAVYSFVTDQISSLDNAMHFIGAGTTLPASADAGDVYVFTGDATDDSGYKSGQEVVYTGSAWEVIGDQNSYALNAYTSTASLYTGVTTVPGALDAIGAAATTWYGKAKTGTSTTDNFYGMTATIVLNSNADPTIALTNGVAGSDIVTASGSITSNAIRLVTANAVHDFVNTTINNIGWSSTSDSSTNGVTVTASVEASASTGVVQVSLKIDAAATAADVSDPNKASNLVTAAGVSAYVDQEITSAISGLDATPTDAGTQGVSVAVVEADGIITGVTTTVNKATLNSTLGTTNVADKTVATSIGATGVDTALATEKAVRDAITDAELVWLDANGNAITNS